MRPLTRVERAEESKKDWYDREEKKARESRGESGAMEFWLRFTRSRMAKEKRAGRGDVYSAFALVCRLFLTAMEQREAGDRRLWDDLLKYAQQVVDRNPPRH